MKAALGKAIAASDLGSLRLVAIGPGARVSLRCIYIHAGIHIGIAANYDHRPRGSARKDGEREAIMDDQFGRDEGTGYDAGASSTSAGAGTAAKMQEVVADKAEEAKSKVADFGRRTREQLDSQRQPMADTLNRTASTLHSQSDKAAAMGHTAADKLETTAEYLRQNDMKAMMSDVNDLARKYPTQTLAVAVGVGFLLGRLFRHSD